MKSYLELKLNGRKAEAIIKGWYSFRKNSNLYHAITRLGFTPADEGKKFEVVVGGRAGKNKNDGYHMAIIRL